MATKKNQSKLPLLSLSYILFSIVFGLLQERVFLIEGFRFGGFMTIITSGVYLICSATELSLSKKPHMGGGFLNYVILAVSTFFGMYFTNWSLQYISFPVRIIFKSGKLIPVMLVSLILGKKISLDSFIKNCTLVAGLAIFILGDSKSSSQNSSIFGLFLISLGIFCDAFTCNFEEHVLLKKHKVSRAAIIFYTNVFSLIYSTIVLALTGELFEAVQHAKTHPEVVPYIAAFSLVNYFSVSIVLAIIQQYGSTEAEVAKTIRKFLSVVLSFVVFTKPLHALHILGGSLFFTSASYGMVTKRNKI